MERKGGGGEELKMVLRDRDGRPGRRKAAITKRECGSLMRTRNSFD